MWTPMFGISARDALVLVDTDVLIWSFRGRNSARAAVEARASVELSAVIDMELAQGATGPSSGCSGEQCAAFTCPLPMHPQRR